MKELWLEIDASLSEEAKDNLMELAGRVCDVVVVEAKDVERAKRTGIRIAGRSDKSDIEVLEMSDLDRMNEIKRGDKAVAVKVVVKGREDEENVIKAAKLPSGYIIVQFPEWKVIPLENLISKELNKNRLLVGVSSAEEAKLALETLELGADGVVLKTSDPRVLQETAAITKKATQGACVLTLMPIRVVEIKPIGIGARVCIDTIDLMKPGEGMLTGCQSSGLLLVEAEIHENPYVEARPFRVNAGPVSLYTLTSSNKTKYLSELKAGDEALIVDREGRIRTTHVGRVKIEWRPMLLIETEYDGKRIKTIVQNAETIRLVTPKDSKPVTDLRIGDEVLALIVEGGRHFGTLVKEEKVEER